MALIKKIQQALGFTPNEERIVMILLGTLLAGAVIKIVQSATNSIPAIDYRVSDSLFAARSRAASEGAPVSALHAAQGKSFSASENTVPKSSRTPAPGSIDINSAGKTELVMLPGIGEAMADRILRYREEVGPFRRIADLRNVKGIGKKKLEQLAPYCRIGK